MNKKEIVSKNTLMIMSIEDELLKRTNKGVISKWSAASWWGFSDLIDLKYNVTFPKGQNFKINKDYFDVNWKSSEKYSMGIESFITNGVKINVYCPERTIAELIKDAKGIFNDVLVKTVRNFFNKMEYSHEKLIEYANIFKVSKEISVFMAVING